MHDCFHVLRRLAHRGFAVLRIAIHIESFVSSVGNRSRDQRQGKARLVSTRLNEMKLKFGLLGDATAAKEPYYLCLAMGAAQYRF